MSNPIPLGSSDIPTTDEVMFTNLVNTVTTVTSITLHQPTGSGAKVISIAIAGTSLTAANVRYSVAFAAGQQSTTIYPGWVLTGTQTLNISASAGSNEANFAASGLRDAA